MVGMDALLANVANLGFPIVVSIYLLVRIEGKLDALTGSIQQLSQTLAKQLP